MLDCYNGQVKIGKWKIYYQACMLILFSKHRRLLSWKERSVRDYSKARYQKCRLYNDGTHGAWYMPYITTNCNAPEPWGLERQDWYPWVSCCNPDGGVDESVYGWTQPSSSLHLLSEFTARVPSFGLQQFVLETTCVRCNSCWKIWLETHRRVHKYRERIELSSLAAIQALERDIHSQRTRSYGLTEWPCFRLCLYPL